MSTICRRAWVQETCAKKRSSSFKELLGVSFLDYRYSLTFCLSSSCLASILTLAQGTPFGHHPGLVVSLPQPGFPLPVEYFSIKGMKALSWACVIFSTGVGIPSITSGGSSKRFGSPTGSRGACWAKAFSNSEIMMDRRFLTTSSRGLAPKARKQFWDFPGVATRTTACCPTRREYSSMFCWKEDDR